MPHEPVRAEVVGEVDVEEGDGEHLPGALHEPELGHALVAVGPEEVLDGGRHRERR